MPMGLSKRAKAIYGFISLLLLLLLLLFFLFGENNYFLLGGKITILGGFDGFG